MYVEIDGERSWMLACSHKGGGQKNVPDLIRITKKPRSSPNLLPGK